MPQSTHAISRTPPPQAQQPGFRTDINGLRAWAVVAVLLYHFGVPGVGGGFAGVDVFFVISGHLMTGVVARALAEGRPAHAWLGAFYLARARRIVPALMLPCATLLVLGWWTLIPADYRLLGLHTLWSLGFVSNIGYWREVGYFDTAAHDKWLLHTWSLSVEWQFYLLLPLGLWTLWRWRRSPAALAAAMALLALTSLGLSLALSANRPMAAYYLLPTRAWELMAGGLVALWGDRWLPSPAQRAGMAHMGMLAIMASFTAFDAAAGWPGWRALVPVLGTVLVLLAGRQDSVWTGHRLAQWLGDRSYALYLWHWPVTVVLAQAGLAAQGGAIAAGLGASLLLAHLSYRGLEQPSRRWLVDQPRARQTWVLVAGCGAVALPAALVLQQGGVPDRLPIAVNQAAAGASDRNPRREACLALRGGQARECAYGGPRLRAIVLGDSHADAVTTAIAAALPEAPDGLITMNYVGCPTVLGVRSVLRRDDPGWRCADFVSWALQRVAQHPPDIPVIVVNRTSGYLLGNRRPGLQQHSAPTVYFSRAHAVADESFVAEFTERLADTTCRLTAGGRSVYLLRPTPEMDNHAPRQMAYALLWHLPTVPSLPLTAYRQRHATTWRMQDAVAARCGARLLDPLPYLCPDGACPAGWDGRPAYFDDDHLSEHGNRRLVPMFAEVFRPAIAR